MVTHSDLANAQLTHWEMKTCLKGRIHPGIDWDLSRTDHWSLQMSWPSGGLTGDGMEHWWMSKNASGDPVGSRIAMMGPGKRPRPTRAYKDLTYRWQHGTLSCMGWQKLGKTWQNATKQGAGLQDSPFYDLSPTISRDLSLRALY